ncbi:MAG: hypothetical protein Q8R15_03790 [Candidatus Micrarchaeota archaeon]|nr:hypothetical protein [Candidatus Micrarchaeota archaeon]
MEELLRELKKMPHVASTRIVGPDSMLANFHDLTVELKIPHLFEKVRRLAWVHGFSAHILHGEGREMLELTRKFDRNVTILFEHSDASTPSPSFKLAVTEHIQPRTRDQIIRFFRGLHGEKRPTGRMRG